MCLLDFSCVLVVLIAEGRGIYIYKYKGLGVQYVFLVFEG